MKSIDPLAFIQDKEAVAAMMEIAASHGNSSVQELSSWWLDFRKTNDWFTLWDWNAENGIAYNVPEATAKLHAVVRSESSTNKEKNDAASEMAQNLEGVVLLRDIAASEGFSKELT